MSPEASERLAQARAASDPTEADRLAVEAIVMAPDFGEAYALRGRLAAQRGDPVVAAHHFRAAFARGDRSLETRAGLSICLGAAGEEKLAARVWTGGPKPSAFDTFAEAVHTQATPIRQMLSAPLPGQGTPALLPGEKGTPAPSVPRTSGVVTKRRSRDMSPAPGLAAQASVVVRRRDSSGGLDGEETRPDSGPPAGAVGQPTPTAGIVRQTPRASGVQVQRTPAPPEQRPSIAGQPSRAGVIRKAITAPPTLEPARPSAPPPAAPQTGGPRLSTIGRPAQPSRPVASVSPPAAPAEPEAGPRLRRVQTSANDWLDNIDSFSAGDTSGDAADWVEGFEVATNVSGGGPRMSAGQALELSLDPGEMQVEARSPVTGRVVRATDQDGVMPDLGGGSDPLVALADFAPELRDALSIAVRLPGPVMSIPGRGPQQLCRAVSVGLSETEAILRDEDRGDAGLVRLPFATLAGIEVLHDGQQVSFHLPDQRTVHLDMRGLRASDWGAATAFLQHLERILG